MDMAHIPYGYRIIGGKACICEEEQEKIIQFYRAYLEGNSIRDAGWKAGIERSRAGLTKILENEVYLGDDYYPALVGEKVFLQVREERRRRYRQQGEPDSSRKLDFIPVPDSFSLREGGQKYEDPVKEAEAIYARIKAESRTR